MYLPSVIGLGLDFSGVMVLGVDLIRIQRGLHAEAAARLDRLDNILEQIGGIDGWQTTVNTDFREGYWDDGMTQMANGTFDVDAAGASIREIIETIAEIGTHVLTLARMQQATIASDRVTSTRSLAFSYVGLILIAAGFFFQLPAYL